MSKLSELIHLCKNSVNLTINLHKDYHETIDEYFTGTTTLSEDRNDIESATYQKMIETDTLIELQFYSETSIRFYRVYHYDVDAAIDIALSTLKT